jgi:UDP-glucose 4-epimerase
MRPTADEIVLVVGVSGLIGRNTAKLLRDNNFKVRGVSRGYGEYRTASAMEADLAGVDLRFGDIADIAFTKEALHGAGRVVFAAGVSGVSASFADPVASRRGMFEPWSVLIEHSNPGTRIVMMSSQLVYGPSLGRPFTEMDPVAPVSPYAENLARMEKEGRRQAEIRKLEVISIRLGNVFGDILWIDQPRAHGMVAMMVHDLVRRHEIRLFGGGSQTVNLLHVDDLARAISLLIGSISVGSQSVFNVSGERLAVRSVAESIRIGVGEGSLVAVPWPAGLERTVANDIELDDSLFRARFGWSRLGSVIEQVERVAQQYSRTPFDPNLGS